MKSTKYTIFFLIIGIPFLVNAQNDSWREYVNQLAEEEVNLTAIDNLYEELLHLESNPLNLNTVTREELKSIPFLKSEEADLIIQFLERNRPVMTVYELRNVRKLSFKTIQLIIPFFYVGEVETNTRSNLQETKRVSDILRYGRHEMQLRIDKTLTARSGYGNFSDSILERYPNRKYRGEDFYNSIRYSFKYKDKIQMGFTAEKDAGEPFLKKEHPKGYDHYGFYFIVNDIGKLKTLALGDYRLSFGQGLILNNDFIGSKAWGIDNVARRTIKPKRHFSTSEYGFFRGAATLFELANISLTNFYSNREIDANISNTGEITSLKIDGLHRTPLEISKKRNSNEQVAGTNINYRKNRFQMGASAVYHKYNRMYNPTLRDYNRYYMRDSSNFNASIDYSYQLPGFILAGETGMSENGSVATLNSLQYRPSANLSLTILYRYFPVTYNALHAQSFSEGNRVQNEKGVFIGTSFRPFKRFALSTYIDFIRFPWAKYGIDSPSKAIDYYFLGTYNITQQSYFEVRYKYKKKEKNTKYPDPDSRTTLPYSTHKIRLRYNLNSNNGWSFKTTADFARYKVKHFDKELGFMISQNINYKGNNKLSGSAYLAYFNAETYNARLYSYERNLLSTFYMPSFYGKGIRYALNGRYDITSFLSLSFKFAYSRYFNRDVISSGTEQINGNSRTDIFSYIRWRF